MKQLSLRKISKIYTIKNRKDKIPVFFDINLDLNSSEINFVYGPSGSGKTTLLDIISQKLKPTAGELSFKNDHFSSNVKIGYYTQNPYDNVFASLSIKDNFELVSKLNPNKRSNNQSWEELLKDLQVNIDVNEKVGKLSTGEIQRIGIALQLIRYPELLILDEPTSNLDRKNIEIVMEKLNNYRQENDCVIVVSTHDQNLSPGHNLLVLFNGRIAKKSIDEYYKEYQSIRKYYKQEVQQGFRGFIEFPIIIQKDKITIPSKIVSILGWELATKVDIQVDSNYLTLNLGNKYETTVVGDDVIINIDDLDILGFLVEQNEAVVNLERNKIEIKLEGHV